MLDVVIEPSVYGGGGEFDIVIYIVTALILICGVVITIKLINKKRDTSEEVVEDNKESDNK